MSVAVFFFFGMILDGLPAILIFFPILYPIAQSLGIHPLHYGVLVIAIVGISIVARPSASAWSSSAAWPRSS